MTRMLAEFVLEEITNVHHTLLKTGARPKVVRRLQRQVRSLVLVCVLTLRQANAALNDTPDSPATDQTNP